MFEKLIKLVRKERVSLFIGSGFSIEAGIPSVSTLKELILDELDNDQQREEHKNDNLDVLSEFYVEEVCTGSRNELISLMKKAFEFEPKCVNDHEMLASTPHFRTLITTNYDTLLEASYPENECHVVRNDVDCTYVGEKRNTIYKIHGDFTAPDNVVITSSDYKKFKGKSWPNAIMWNDVCTEFLKKHILFIGYSLSDDNIIEIISRISKHVHKNQKQMFLIAPSIKSSYKTRLKKMKVQCYEAVATDFFKELNDSLLENISDDFRHKDVSAETFSRFCHSHKYDPNVSIGSKPTDQNHINDVKSLNGEPLNHSIKMTVSAAIKDKIVSHDFEKYGEYVPESTLYKDVPVIRLAGEDLIRCTHEVNGVVLSKDVASILIGPVERKIDLSISIPGREFFKQLQARAYTLNNHKILIYVDCHIFDIAINITFGENVMNVTFNFNFRKKYSDNDEALKWIDVIIAFFSNEKVYIKELSTNPINTTGVQDISEYPFNEYKEYYQNIKEIEMLTNKTFEFYNECTKERYDCSRIVKAYLKHEYLVVKRGDESGLSFSTNDVEYGEFTNEVKVNDSISIVSTTDKQQKISLNDRVFQIPYVHEVYNSCTVKGISPNERGKVKIDFLYPQNIYHVLYSDKSASVEYPGLKSLSSMTNREVVSTTA